MELIIDIKNNLQEYLPSIFLLLNGNNIDWKKISENYQKELFYRKSKFNKKTDTILVEACLFDIITKVIKEDSHYFNLLKFFDDIFINLSNKTNENEKKRLRKTIYNLLINTNNKYLNFIGEFAVLNNFKNAGFELLKTEQLLNATNKESTTIDFTIRRNSKTFLIEVMNVHLKNSAGLNDEIIERTLSQKISEKLIHKQKKSNEIFYLIPVLWGEYQSIKKVNDYIQNSNFNFKNTLMPCSYMSYFHKNDKLAKNMFGPINKLIIQE